jgi:hypothetical protein
VGAGDPAELVKDQSKIAFESIVNAELPARLERKIAALLDGRMPEG